MKKFIIALAGISTLALAGCISQEQADAKLKVGCQAAVDAMIAPRTIKEVKASSAEDEKTLGSVYRRVKLTYVENDDFAESPHEGSCLFSQQWGMMKSTHAAMLEQTVYNNTVIGKDSAGNIQGDMNQFMQLNEKVNTAMGSQ